MDRVWFCYNCSGWCEEPHEDAYEVICRKCGCDILYDLPKGLYERDMAWRAFESLVTKWSSVQLVYFDTDWAIGPIYSGHMYVPEWQVERPTAIETIMTLAAMVNEDA